MIDLYCERLGPGLLAEPLNAVTNIGFFVAAWASWRRAATEGKRMAATTSLIALMILIGLGSLSFHVLATQWSRVADVAPILLFQLRYLWLYLRYAGGVKAMIAISTVAGFLCVALVTRRFPEIGNGSLNYVPALLLQLGLSLHQRRHQYQGANLLLLASGLFLLSLVFRTVDLALCPWWSIGTHCFWHLLNAAVIYLLIRALMPHLSIPIPRQSGI